MARRPIGPKNPRARKNRGQAGTTPYTSIAEQNFNAAAAPAGRNVENIQSRPPVSQPVLNRYVDSASVSLSPEKRAALRRAQWAEGDDALLDVRPTNTSDDTRPRTLAAGYDEESETLFVRFRGRHTGNFQYSDGIGYEYYGVSPQQWQRFRDNWSPGRYINDVLDGHPYTPATW